MYTLLSLPKSDNVFYCLSHEPCHWGVKQEMADKFPVSLLCDLDEP